MKDLIWTLIVRTLIILAGLFSSIATARLLGPEGRGVFFYWSTLAALAIQFGNLGLHASNTYLLTKKQVPIAVLAKYSLRITIASSPVLGLILILYVQLSLGELKGIWSLVLPTLVMIPAGLYFLFGTNLLLAANNLKHFNAFELSNRYLGLIAVVCTAWYWRTPQAVLIAVATVTLSICALIYLRLKITDPDSSSQFGRSFLKEGLGYALRAYIAAALGFAVLRLNALMIAQQLDAIELGKWSIASQLLDVIAVIPSTVALVLLPKIMRSQRPYKMMLSQLLLVSTIVIPVCIVFVAIGESAIRFLYGDDFNQAYILTLYGLPGVIALGLIGIVSQYLASLGIPLALIGIWLVGLAAEFLLAKSLIPSRGAVGAMIALSATYSLILMLVWCLAARESQKVERRAV